MTDDPLGERLRHDLRTPLAVIMGFADLLERRDGISDEERRDYAQRITAAVREMRDLLDRPRE
jgi:signal transduction histidine kinase